MKSSRFSRSSICRLVAEAERVLVSRESSIAVLNAGSTCKVMCGTLVLWDLGKILWLSVFFHTGRQNIERGQSLPAGRKVKAFSESAGVIGRSLSLCR